MTRIGSKSYSRMKLIEIGDVGRFVGWVGGGSGEPPRSTRTKRRFLISAFLLFSRTSVSNFLRGLTSARGRE